MSKARRETKPAASAKRPVPNVSPALGQSLALAPAYLTNPQIVHLQGVIGNQAVMRLLQAQSVQRQDAVAEQTPLQILIDELDDFFVDEALVVQQIKLLSGADLQTFFASDTYKKQANGALTFAEMREAVEGHAEVTLVRRMEWLRGSAKIERAISYDELAPMIRGARAGEGMAFDTPEWRAFFMKVCTNKTIFDAVRDLGLAPKTQIEWILDEGNSGYLGPTIDSADVYELLKDNPALTDEQKENLRLFALNNTEDADREEIRRIMDSKPNAREENQVDTTFDDAAAERDEDAQELMERWVKDGDVTKLSGVEWAMFIHQLYLEVFKDPSLVRQVLEKISFNISVLGSLIGKFRSEEEITMAAADSAGRDLLLQMVQHMPGNVGGTFKPGAWGTTEIMQKIMQVLTKLDNAERLESGASSEVEIITFLYGHDALDEVGTVLGGYRGHTAIVVNGMVYSYEDGWRAGMSKAQYLQANAWRDAVGHIIAIPEEDIEPLQNNLNAAVGTGIYIAENDICTGKTTKMLEEHLPHVESPQLLASYLETSEIVTGRKYYAKVPGATP